jgi:formate hydrogenlyase subunit 3/multisubunit Na+/H+ antiporter MnhD subunit
LVTIMQKDLKRLVAYASIVDVAFIVLGFFAFSDQGVTGGVLEMVNHGLTTGAIFFSSVSSGSGGARCKLQRSGRASEACPHPRRGLPRRSS